MGGLLSRVERSSDVEVTHLQYFSMPAEPYGYREGQKPLFYDLDVDRYVGRVSLLVLFNCLIVVCLTAVLLLMQPPGKCWDPIS